MHLVILAGGKGTRLAAGDLPKPMVEIAGKPVLQWTLEWAQRSGLRDITIISQYRAEQISDWLGNGSAFGVRIRHVVEDQPMGTAGAVRLLKDHLRERFMVVFGDLICDFDADRLIAFDAAGDSLATIVVHPNNHPHDSDLVELGGPDQSITAMHPKPHVPGHYHQNLVNAGVFVLSPDIFDRIPTDGPCDFGRELFPRLVAEGEHLRGYSTFEYITDMGTPDRRTKVERDIGSGRVAGRHRRHPQRAIFLDRDGVLNHDAERIVSPADLQLIDGAGDAVRRINESDFLAIVVTNQPGLAKGFLTETDLDDIHRRLEWTLAEDHAFLDGLYYCPHHPETGFAGEVLPLKIVCDCRKPASGMLEHAARDFNLDLARCWMIGDRAVDLEAARRVGAAGILVDGRTTLGDAVQTILGARGST